MTHPRQRSLTILTATLAVLLGACATQPGPPATNAATTIEARLGGYTTVRLTADLGALDERQRQVVRLLIEAAQPMDAGFWKQAYGDRDALLSAITDPATRRFAEINYGPWDRLDDNEPFVEGVGPKPAGANFYPADMTKEEFEAAVAAAPDQGAALKGTYTVVRRGEDGAPVAVPYSRAFAAEIEATASKLEAAAKLAVDPGFARYLELRARALRSDDYRPSDMAWMDMKNNALDIVVGPIETYEDRLFGYKAAFEAYVLIKDLEWSKRLTRYVAMLPELQRGLPVPAEYKREEPGTDSDLNAYDVVYYAGDCNAGSKTIAINLPNDEEVQLAKGTRRLQLKNAMRAKFDEILLPIANQLVAEDQRKHVTFDAFFANTMFHEVAHGLGIKKTLDGSSTVREALREQASALEEGKADVLGLFMVTRLHGLGEIGPQPLEDYYTTFLAGIFRSIRFGAASAHGRANMVRFNFFQGLGAFERQDDGTYRADFDKMKAAVDALSERILRLQGEGDYQRAVDFTESMDHVPATLQADLDGLGRAGIPVDIVFEQGTATLGL